MSPSTLTFKEVEVGDNARIVGEGESPPEMDSENSQPQDQDPTEVSSLLHAAHGAMIPRSSTGIKKEKTKTCWFMVWSERAISKPPVLHTSIPLELGDLYINQFYSTHHHAQVLQVWLLVTDSGKDTWKQGTKIGESEKVHHPTLKKRVLAFQPSDTQTIPTWILPNTDRRQRATQPRIVLG
ncbi:hypothetical protein BC826DRAFT_972996 [Russula brevipes]|nr:hypothetical protein BC826DRAFT_972996 [Russula brevipes]